MWIKYDDQSIENAIKNNVRATPSNPNLYASIVCKKLTEKKFGEWYEHIPNKYRQTDGSYKFYDDGERVVIMETVKDYQYRFILQENGETYYSDTFGIAVASPLWYGAY